MEQIINKIKKYLNYSTEVKKTITNIEVINKMSETEKGLLLKIREDIWGRISSAGNGKLKLQFFEPMGTDASKTIEITSKEAKILIKALFDNPVFR